MSYKESYSPVAWSQEPLGPDPFGFNEQAVTQRSQFEQPFEAPVSEEGLRDKVKHLAGFVAKRTVSRYDAPQQSPQSYSPNAMVESSNLLPQQFSNDDPFGFGPSINHDPFVLNSELEQQPGMSIARNLGSHAIELVNNPNLHNIARMSGQAAYESVKEDYGINGVSFENGRPHVEIDGFGNRIKFGKAVLKTVASPQAMAAEVGAKAGYAGLQAGRAEAQRIYM